MVLFFKFKSSYSPFSIKIPLHKKSRLLESTSKIEFELYESNESEKAYWSAKSMRDGDSSFSFVDEAQTVKVEYSSSDSADFGTAKGLVIKFSVLGICHERLFLTFQFLQLHCQYQMRKAKKAKVLKAHFLAFLGKSKADNLYILSARFFHFR